MHKLALAAPAAALIALAGCSSDTATDAGDAATPSVVESPTAMESEPAEETAQPDAMDTMEEEARPAGGKYVTESKYRANEAAYQEGNTVLFFYAAWCPDCQQADASIRETGVPEDINVVKIDYDAANDLRKEYGVTQQHTFVLIGPDGEQVKKWTGSSTADDIASKVS
jgi:thioredoxin 1